MNGKKAKELRKIAKAIAVENNVNLDNDYEKTSKQKIAYSLDGKPIIYTVYTAKLKDCVRNIYQQLKKEGVK